MTKEKQLARTTKRYEFHLRSFALLQTGVHSTIWLHLQKENNMILLLPLVKVLIVITVLFGLWVLLGVTILFAFVSVLITGLLLIRQHNII